MIMKHQLSFQPSTDAVHRITLFEDERLMHADLPAGHSILVKVSYLDNPPLTSPPIVVL